MQVWASASQEHEVAPSPLSIPAMLPCHCVAFADIPLTPDNALRFVQCTILFYRCEDYLTANYIYNKSRPLRGA
ncbi:hypothetical protein OQH61_03205 [Helicobacter sp. MIT 21-1697]|uniref:hypothetical protein n=1 Tax=Helicobacter sp. MIT 21-1697 TaxID=2993733 RepID=UPI00224BA197|nr:hypothetical protein [Helicobacter sp. MIT 21-1697]MCX2716740.1 hypothetical protein [Helicobacter sp. MIT 21-1697]